MRSHPVFLRLEGRRCLIVGGDSPAAAKAAACARAGASVTVVAQTLEAELASLAAKGAVRHVPRAYRAGDLAGMFLAYVSSRDPEAIRQLADEAERERVLLNVIDVPAASSFISPAVVERGDLKVAVGTGGASPALAARLRQELEQRVGPEYGPFVAILGAVRRLLADDPSRAADRGEVVTRLVTSPLLELVRGGRRGEIDALLCRLAGEGCTLDRLGVAIGDPR
jgi:precorrin-2 dehydrogenase/sirohydrochlorin ferrochelatase